MGDLVLARRYAHVLVSLSSDAQGLEKVIKDVDSFISFLEKSPDLKTILLSKKIPLKSKLQIAGDISQKAHFSEISSNMICLLIEKKRLHLIDAISLEYKKEIKRRNGEVEVLVTVADDSIIHELEGEITKTIKKKFGKQPSISFITDKDLIGGLQIKIEDHLYDMSVKGELKQIREKIIRGIYGNQS